MWETVLSDAFALMGDTDELKPVERVLVEVAFAAVIILIVLCVHLYVRDWASDGLLEEQQRTQQQQRSAANSIDSTSAPQMSTITI